MSMMPEPFLVAPESKTKVNYEAFKEDDIYLRLFPGDIVHRLKDEDSVENRKAALTIIRDAIQQCQDLDILTENLQSIVILVTLPLNDSNIKIVLTGLQVLRDLVDKVRERVSPYLHHLLSAYLEKISSNKYNVKQAGMNLLTHLMSVVGPMKVIEVVMEHGLTSRRSKVREEALNIVIVTLLYFPDSGFNLLLIIEKITPLLADSKQKVRQSSLEACVILGTMLGKEGIQYLVSAVASVEKSLPCSNPPLSLMQAFQTRLSRTDLPTLNNDGLVDHVVNVANGKNANGLTGPDVDWILAASGKSSSPGVGGRKQLAGGAGPLKSAGKKLPWDNKEKTDSQPQPQPTTYSRIYMYQQQHHLKSTFTPSVSSSGSLAASPRPKGYLEMHQDRTLLHASVSTEAPLKHLTTSSVSKEVVRDTFNKEPVILNGFSEMSSGDTELFATTWPRTNSYYNSFMKKTSRQISVDSSTLNGGLLVTQSNRSTLPAIGGRPLSKPLVRNLFPQPTPLVPAADSPVPPPLPLSMPHDLFPPSQPVNATSSNNPAQIEKSFLGGQLEDDQEYYSIPADDSLLNSSLSSSLTSLCATRDLQSANISNRKKSGAQTVDCLSKILKKAETLKAEVLSAQCSASTSPIGTPPLMHGSSPQKGQSHNKSQLNTVSAPAAQRRNSQKNISQNSTLSTPHVNMYSSRHLLQQKDHQGEEKEEPIVNTMTFGEQGRSSMKAKKTVGAKPRSRTNSYAEAATLRKNSKLLSSPEHDTLTKRPLGNHSRQPSNTHISDLELTLENPAPPRSKTNSDANFSSSPFQKPKKHSPQKPANTPLKSNRQSLSPINSSCSSAPVYRTAPEVPNLDDSLVELEPHSNPESAIKEIFEDLKSGPEQWEKKCNGLLTIRKLAAYNPEILMPQLQTVVMAVNEEVKNLRSQVARGAIACLGDMFAFLGRDMEQSLDSIVKTLLKVGSKSNTFYREDVEKVINEMIRGTSPSKCISSLLGGGMGHANTAVRRLFSQNLCSVVEHHRAERMLKQPRDVLERFLTAMATLLADSDVGARYYARRSINELCFHPEFEQIATRCLSKQHLTKVREMVEILKTKGVGKPPPELNSAKTTRQSMSGSHPISSNRSVTAPSSGPSPPFKQDSNPQRTRRRRISAATTEGATVKSSPGIIEVPLPEGMLSKMSANDWNERQQAITELEAFIMSHPSGMGSNIVKVFDVFNQRLVDQNSKVNLHALESFQRFIPLIGSQLQPVLSTLVEALVRTVASRYPTIHSAAINAVETLIRCVDHSLLLPPLSSAAQNGNARVQPFMLRKLADIIPCVYQQKPALVQRVTLPVLWKVLSLRSPATGEAKSALQTLCNSLYHCMGSAGLESVMVQQPPDQQQRLRDILRNLS